MAALPTTQAVAVVPGRTGQQGPGGLYPPVPPLRQPTIPPLICLHSFPLPTPHPTTTMPLLRFTFLAIPTHTMEKWPTMYPPLFPVVNTCRPAIPVPIRALTPHLVSRHQHPSTPIQAISYHLPPPRPVELTPHLLCTDNLLAMHTLSREPPCYDRGKSNRENSSNKELKRRPNNKWQLPQMTKKRSPLDS